MFINNFLAPTALAGPYINYAKLHLNRMHFNFFITSIARVTMYDTIVARDETPFSLNCKPLTNFLDFSHDFTFIKPTYYSRHRFWIYLSPATCSFLSSFSGYAEREASWTSSQQTSLLLSSSLLSSSYTFSHLYGENMKDFNSSHKQVEREYDQTDILETDYSRDEPIIYSGDGQKGYSENGKKAYSGDGRTAYSWWRTGIFTPWTDGNVIWRRIDFS